MARSSAQRMPENPEVKALLPLRERKKQQTRRKLVEIAQDLFLSQGYAATTLEQICERADVSVATLLRYFDSKERLALYPWYHSLERFRAEVRAPDRAEGGMVLWRRWVETEAARHPAEPGSGVEIRRFLQGSPELVARILAIHQEQEDLLAEALARDAGTDPATDLYSQMLAATLVAMNRTSYRHWVERGAVDDLAHTSLGAVDFVLSHLPPRAAAARKVTAAPSNGGPARAGRRRR